MLARHLLQVGAIEEAAQVLRRFQENRAMRSDADRQAPGVPLNPDTTLLFFSPGLVPESAGVDPFFAPAVYAEGFTLLQQGNYEKALAAFRGALGRDPLTAGPGVESGALQRGAAAFRDGAVETATEHLKVALELSPESAEAHRLLGSVYVADARYDEGIRELETAVRVRPSDERARLALAAAFTKPERYPAAVRTLQQAITALPASGRARYELGLVYRRQGLYAEALAAFDEALTFKPLIGLNTLYKTMGFLRRARQDVDGAIEIFARRIDLVPNDADAHQELGVAYFRQGRHDEALVELCVSCCWRPAPTPTRPSDRFIYATAPCRGRRLRGRPCPRPDHMEARYVLATPSCVSAAPTKAGRSSRSSNACRPRGGGAQPTARTEGLRRDAMVSSANGDHAKAIVLLRKCSRSSPTRRRSSRPRHRPAESRPPGRRGRALTPAVTLQDTSSCTAPWRRPRRQSASRRQPARTEHLRTNGQDELRRQVRALRTEACPRVCHAICCAARQRGARGRRLPLLSSRTSPRPPASPSSMSTAPPPSATSPRS